MAVHIINMSPRRPLGLQIPQELWIGSKPNYDKLRIIGCKAYDLVSKDDPESLNQGPIVNSIIHSNVHMKCTSTSGCTLASSSGIRCVSRCPNMKTTMPSHTPFLAPFLKHV